MPKIHFNKEDWTGGCSHVNVLDDGKFTLENHGDTVYRLEKIEDEIMGDYAKIKGSDWDWLGEDYKLGIVFKSGDRFIAMDSGVERSGDNPFTAAAKLLCNLV